MKWFPKSRPAEPRLAGFVVPQSGTLASLASPAGGHLVNHFDRAARRAGLRGDVPLALHGVTFGFVAKGLARVPAFFLAGRISHAPSKPTTAPPKFGLGSSPGDLR